MFLRFCGRRFAFEQLLDQIDASTRPIELIAENLIRRAGCVTEAAMHARAQDFIGFVGTRQTAGAIGKVRLHAVP
jgi:hypothetical protein